ncbi:MAG: hypothetical protein O9302_12225 [Cyclobacteriaceae bacterium]|nr:hypothetical protein [Cytophagales bacterium]MCZ8328822.1 hypothetical protein [Cyclobacteriaceae bacterium]
MNKLILLFWVSISASLSVKSQDADSVFIQTDSLFLSGSDSLAIFNLIDSILLAEDKLDHQLSFRLGYNSNILAAGRTMGFENFGLAPSLSYFSSFGLFADVSGYWSDDIVLEYYLTTLSLGYMHVFNSYFSVMAGYDRYLYRFDENSYIPYTNSWTITPSFDYKFINFNLNYLFYTGDKHAHRLLPSLGVTLQKRNWKGIKRIAFFPSVSLLYGDEKFYLTEYVEPKTIREALQNIQKYGSRFSIVEKEIHEFGIMNVALNFPVSITYKKWNFMFSYAYHIPKALPSETLVLSESSFFSANLSYTISLRKNKNLWD